MMDECSSTSLDELFSVAKSPQNTDTGQTRITGCLDIHLAVANIHGLILIHTKLAQGQTYHIGSRFATNALAFSNGDIHHIAEIGLIKFIYTCLQFIAYDSGLITLGMYVAKHFGNAFIEASCVLTMFEIIRLKYTKALLEVTIINILRNSLFYKFSNTISNKATNLRQRPFRPPHLTKGIVSAVAKILKGIRKGSIQIKDDSAYRTHRTY